jgi:hypothetical protein
LYLGFRIVWAYFVILDLNHRFHGPVTLADMTLHLLRKGCAIAYSLLILLTSGFAQKNPQSFEKIINDYLGAYELTPDNLFRLAAYTEMKGKYSSDFQTLTLDFGDLGQMAFYEKNVLLRTHSNRVYHMDKAQKSAALAKIMNRNLSSLFEKIILLSNHNADPAQVAFVDKHLARKNIEPFDKIFLRHILIRYGKFDRENQRVVFHTDWVTNDEWSNQVNGKTVKKPAEPLKIKLDSKIVRGYYLWSGGTVYVENVNRDVVYATGENYGYNVAAFKLMVQKLFSQTTHFIVSAEQQRIDEMPNNYGAITELQVDIPEDTYVILTPERMNTRGMSARKVSPTTLDATPRQPRPLTTNPVRSRSTIYNAPANTKAKQLYSPYAWIPMMLGILRANGVNIGDEDVIKYFINQPYFPKLYDQLTKEERDKVDLYKDN